MSVDLGIPINDLRIDWDSLSFTIPHLKSIFLHLKDAITVFEVVILVVGWMRCHIEWCDAVRTTAKANRPWRKNTCSGISPNDGPEHSLHRSLWYASILYTWCMFPVLEFKELNTTENKTGWGNHKKRLCTNNTPHQRLSSVISSVSSLYVPVIHVPPRLVSSIRKAENSGRVYIDWVSLQFASRTFKINLVPW